MLFEAGHIVSADLLKVAAAAGAKARVFKYAPANGYTHNQIAEPVTIGKRFADFEILMRGQLRRFDAEVQGVRRAKIRGAVGIFGGGLTPAFERSVADILEMGVAGPSTQILPIESLAQFFAPLSIIAGIVENFAQNLRLASGDLAEIKEGFRRGQTGSSIMTFKQNPINIENITGAARKIKALAGELMSATATWRERDISNSFQVQRHIIPEMFEAAEHIAKKTLAVIENLQVFPIQAHRNLAKYGDFIFAGAAKDFFATQPDAASCAQSEIYSLIQEHSIAAKYAADFRGEKSLLFDALAPSVGENARADLRRVLSLPYNLRNAREYYDVVYGARQSDDGAHDAMVDYIVDSGQLARFKPSDSAAFICDYWKICDANYAGGKFADERRALAAACARFTAELEK
jgi:adenylosuccinate lyase